LIIQMLVLARSKSASSRCYREYLRALIVSAKPTQFLPFGVGFGA